MSYPDVNLKRTAAGLALDAKIQAGNGAVTLDLVDILTTDSLSEDPVNMTEVVGYKQTLTILSKRSVGPRAVIKARLVNKDAEHELTESYSITQYVFRAMDPDDGLIIYRVSQFASHPLYMPRFGEPPYIGVFGREPSFNIVVGDDAELHVEVSPVGDVQPEDIYASVELSSAEVPQAGVRTHYRVLADVPWYTPLGAVPVVTHYVVAQDETGAYDGALMLDDGEIIHMSLQTA